MTRDDDRLTSDITDCLVAMLQQRDAMGRAKYGKTLDRDDLTPEQWAQHMAEELLDGAGYAMAYAREVAKMRTERDALLTVRETLKREVNALKAENDRLKQLARRAVCSLGSFDRSLSEYYETALNATTGEGHE